MRSRDAKLRDGVQHAVANFIERESNRTSLITVTQVHVAADRKQATIFISVLPAHKETAALDFVKRKKGEVRTFLTHELRTRILPRLDFEIDRGEKARQRIDEILANDDQAKK